MNVGDIVRVEAGDGAIEGKVTYIAPMGGYNMVHIETGWRTELVPDDMYDVQVLRAHVPEEPTELGAVYTRDNVDYVRWTNEYLAHWISSITGTLYEWKEIHE